MHGLIGRLAKLEAIRQAQEQEPDRPVMPRILLVPEDWKQVQEGDLIHMGGNPPRVYRYLGGYTPETSSCQAEELDIPYWSSWGLQPVDFIVLAI